MEQKKTDVYSNFDELSTHEKAGKDYEIHVREGHSGIAVIAPHGGGIEPVTDLIADRIAGAEHSFYSFRGIKKSENSNLHITSEKFDEPRGVKIVESADLILSIHGCSGNEEVVYIGGRDDELMEQIGEKLNRAGFMVRRSMKPKLRGKKPFNICNRGRTRRGVQLEISEGLRKRMFSTRNNLNRKGETEVFHKFVASVREVFSLSGRDF